MSEKPYIGKLCGIREVEGMKLSKALKEFDWGIIDCGYEWVPVINDKGIVVDIFNIRGEPDRMESFEHSRPVVWDGYAGAYRVAA